MEIEELKKEILLKIMNRERMGNYMYALPIDGELRTFMCELSPLYALRYAKLVDKCPHEETRKASYRDPRWKCSYKARFGE